MRKRLKKLSAAIAGLSFLPIYASAYDLPAVNLGSTSFLDGDPPAGPGFYFQEYVSYYTADTLKDANGDTIPLPDPELDNWVSLSQFIYLSDKTTLFGGKLGVSSIIPYVSLDFTPTIVGLQDNGDGLGDIVVGPFVQWDTIMGSSGPRFMHRIELQAILPTGKYDDDRALNPGSNFFSFNPYWAATFFATPQWTVSWRLHYLWNDKNDKPNVLTFPGADDVQAGQAIHLNLNTAFEVIPKKLRLGVNAYYLDQLSDTKVDGHKVSDRQEKVFGVGPGVVYHFSRDSHLFFNAYFESGAENRTEGERFNLRYVHHF